MAKFPFKLPSELKGFEEYFNDEPDVTIQKLEAFIRIRKVEAVPLLLLAWFYYKTKNREEALSLAYKAKHLAPGSTTINNFHQYLLNAKKDNSKRPVKKDSSKTPMKEKSKHVVPKRRRKPLILTIEDDSGISRLVDYQLAKMPVTVENRYNGIEGFKAIKELLPDLVILDVMLPGMSGFDILHKIRQDEETKDTKVMMLTAKNQEKDMKRAFDHHVVEYMSKPFKLGELSMRINRILELN